MTIRTSLLSVIALLLFGCGALAAQPSSSRNPDPEQRESADYTRRGQDRLSGTEWSGATDRPAGNRINHVVLFWLKASGNASHRQRIIETSRTFRRIPGVLEVRVGQAVPSEREIVDDSFDVALSIAFANPDDMARYIGHPLHEQAVREIIRPLVERIVVYDFVE